MGISLAESRTEIMMGIRILQLRVRLAIAGLFLLQHPTIEVLEKKRQLQCYH